MWPPRRSVARSASSRLTDEPCSMAPSEERRSVSCMTSAPKRSPLHSPTAVRQTPLTATLSPSLSSDASFDSIATRTPSDVSCTSATFPRSWTSPVNTRLPLLETSRDEQVVADGVARQRQRPQRVVDALDALALERVARGAAAEQQRRQEKPDLVDLAGVEERAGEVRA